MSQPIRLTNQAVRATNQKPALWLVLLYCDRRVNRYTPHRSDEVYCKRKKPHALNFIIKTTNKKTVPPATSSREVLSQSFIINARRSIFIFY